MNHLLIEKAFRYQISDTQDDISNNVYDSTKGFWVNCESGIASIDDPNFRAPRSKKADIETGEDKKGE